MASEKEIKRDNLEADLHVLKSEIDEKTTELTLILKQKDAASIFLSQFEADKIAFEKEKADHLENVSAHQAQVVKDRQTIADEKEAATEQLANIKEDTKEANKILARVNNSCINGESEFKELTTKKENLEIKVSELTTLVANFEEIKENVRIAREEEALINRNIEARKIEADEYVKEKKEEAAKYANEAQISITTRDQTQIETKRYSDEMYNNMNDWQIIRERLQTRWNQVFPELDMPLTQ